MSALVCGLDVHKDSIYATILSATSRNFSLVVFAGKVYNVSVYRSGMKNLFAVNRLDH